MSDPITIAQSVTYWLREWGGGDDHAIEQVTALIYRDLRRLAARFLNGERDGHTLQPTALVHEAYLHISALRDVDWKERRQFIALVAQSMRRILIDHARKRKAARRNPETPCVTPPSAIETPSFDVLAVDQALERMSAKYPRQAQVVELRFFGGLNPPEIANALEISLTTVERDWRFAKAWLQAEMSTSISLQPERPVS